MDCFVIMPFSTTTHFINDKEVMINNDEWNFIFNNWIKKAVESYPDTNINCIRSRQVSGNFVKGIVNDLYNSRLVIADLTGQKPNVYYELGIRHALKLGTIMITQNFIALPSDLASYFCFEYNYSNNTHEYEKMYNDFERKLHEKIKHVLENLNNSDNPVSDFLALEHYYSVNRYWNQINKFEYFFNKILQGMNEYNESIRLILKNKERFIEEKTLPFVFIDINKVNMYFQALVVSDWSELPIKEIEQIITTTDRLRSLYNKIYDSWGNVLSNCTEIGVKSVIAILETLIADEKVYGPLLNETKNKINSIKSRNK